MHKSSMAVGTASEVIARRWKMTCRCFVRQQYRHIDFAYRLTLDAWHRLKLHYMSNEPRQLLHEIGTPFAVHLLARVSRGDEKFRKERTCVQHAFTALARALERHSKWLAAGVGQELRDLAFIQRKHMTVLACPEFRADD